MGWVVNATPRPFYHRERPGTHCIGGWVGTSSGLDGCGKFRPHITVNRAFFIFQPLITLWSRVLPEKLRDFPAIPEIPNILWNQKAHYCVFNSPPPVPILRQINSVRDPPHPTFWRSVLILCSHVRPFPKWTRTCPSARAKNYRAKTGKCRWMDSLR